MQAAVFVYESSLVSFSHPVSLTRFDSSRAPCNQVLAAGEHALTKGLYAVCANGAVTIAGSYGCDIVPIGADTVLPNPTKTLGRFAAAFPDPSYAWLCEQLGATAWQATTNELSRVAIVVYEPATIVLDRLVTLTRFPGGEASDFKAGPGKVALSPGVYRMVAGGNAILEVSPACDALISIAGKDPIPDIAALLGRYRAAFGDISHEALCKFFPTIERGFHPKWAPESTLVGVPPAPRG